MPILPHPPSTWKGMVANSTAGTSSPQSSTRKRQEQFTNPPTNRNQNDDDDRYKRNKPQSSYPSVIGQSKSAIELPHQGQIINNGSYQTNAIAPHPPSTLRGMNPPANRNQNDDDDRHKRNKSESSYPSPSVKDQSKRPTELPRQGQIINNGTYKTNAIAPHPPSTLRGMNPPANRNQNDDDGRYKRNKSDSSYPSVLEQSKRPIELPRQGQIINNGNYKTNAIAPHPPSTWRGMNPPANRNQNDDDDRYKRNKSESSYPSVIDQSKRPNRPSELPSQRQIINNGSYKTNAIAPHPPSTWRGMNPPANRNQNDDNGRYKRIKSESSYPSPSVIDQSKRPIELPRQGQIINNGSYKSNAKAPHPPSTWRGKSKSAIDFQSVQSLDPTQRKEKAMPSKHQPTNDQAEQNKSTQEWRGRRRGRRTIAHTEDGKKVMSIKETVAVVRHSVDKKETAPEDQLITDQEGQNKSKHEWRGRRRGRRTMANIEDGQNRKSVVETVAIVRPTVDKKVKTPDLERVKRAQRLSKVEEKVNDNDKKVDKKIKVEVKESPTVEPEPKLLKITRLDGVTGLVILAQILLIVAMGLEGHAYNVDFTYWNNLLEGDKIVKEVDSSSIFNHKTLDLENHHYLVKAKGYLKRTETKEIAFFVVILIVLVATAIHLYGYYIKTADLEDRAAIVIALYAVSGAVCIFIGVFLVSSAIQIENSYTYAADMFFNFQHFLDGEDPIHNQADCPSDNYVRGCPSYEYAKKQSKDLEDIFRLCGVGSRFTRYYEKSVSDDKKIFIAGEEFTRPKLKSMGFCSPDGYKYMAAIFSTLAGIQFSIVPVVFCCETRSTNPTTFIDAFKEEQQERWKHARVQEIGRPNQSKEKRKYSAEDEEKSKLQDKKPSIEDEKRTQEKQEDKRKTSIEEESQKSERLRSKRQSRDSSEQPRPRPMVRERGDIIAGWKTFIESDS